MPHFPSIHFPHMKEADREAKGELQTDGNVIVQHGDVAMQTTPESTATSQASPNKLRKHHPFSFHKRPNSTSSTYSERSISVTMPFPGSTSEESMSEAKSALLTAPTRESGRLRKSSFMSMRSASWGHRTNKQSTKDGDTSSSASLSSVSTSQSTSPMKKVKSKAKETIHWVQEHLHGRHHSHDHLHVTSKSRSRSSSTSSGYFHSSQASNSTTSFPPASTSSAFTEVFGNPNLEEFKAESEGKQEQITILEESVEVGPELRTPLVLVVVEPSSTTEMADSDEPLPESSAITSTILPPAIEMPIPVLCESPAFPMPVTVNAEPGGVQPGEVRLNSEHTSVHVEQEVPDPLIGEESNAMSVENKRETFVVPSLVLPDAQKINLDSSSTNDSTTDIPATSPVISEPLISSPPHVDKLPHEEPALQAREGNENVPDLFLPGLTTRTLLSPVPNTDPLSTLLSKYIYPSEKRPVRDVTGEWQRTDIHTLVMTNSWRALSKMAKDRIVVSNPSDVENILELWYLRLASLARLRLSNQTAAECTNLFAVLNAIEPMEHRIYVFERILPFELEIMSARVKYWSGNHMGYLDALSALLRKCKRKTKEASAITQVESEVQEMKDMWRERGARVSLILASQLVEMKDFVAATKLLEPLCTQLSSTTQGKIISNPHLRSAMARIHIQSGNLQLAAYHFGIVAQDPDADEPLKKLNDAILSAARGEWERSVQILKEMMEEDVGHLVAMNNLSMALFNQGKLKEAINVLERALNSSPSTMVVAEPFLFNLSTLYELRSAAGLEKKKDLLIQVAKWSGDGLRVDCLKMPTI